MEPRETRVYRTSSVYVAALWRLEGHDVWLEPSDVVGDGHDSPKVYFCARLTPGEFARLERAFKLRYRHYARNCSALFDQLLALKRQRGKAQAMSHGRDEGA